MGESHLSRYMSLAKYVDLLRSRAVFCPKASLFNDQTEGKWVAHAVLWGEKERWNQARHNAELLEKLIEEASGDEQILLLDAGTLYETMTPLEKRSVLGDILRDLPRTRSSMREEYLRVMAESWLKHHDKYNDSVQEWMHQVAIDRESTYVSCWNRGASMSLAMWSLYGGSSEAVAIRTRPEKLQGLLDENRRWLNSIGLDGEIIDVAYVEGLKEPSVGLQDDLVDRLNVGKDVKVGSFSIKPSMYAYEEEVRIIIYPVRGIFEKVVDPHPELDGISLTFGGSYTSAHGIEEFIESVHLHPTLSSDSMMVRVVAAINAAFGVPALAVVTDRIEAIGPDMRLEPTERFRGNSA